MRDALQHPDVRTAVAWYSVVVAAGLFAMVLLPNDGWLSIAPMLVVVAASLVAGTALLVRAATRGAPRGQLVAIAVCAACACLLAVVIAFAAILGIGLVLGFPLVLAVGAALAFVLTGRGVPPYAPMRWGAVGAGAGASLALVGLGVADAIVWLPATLVPDVPVAEVHATLAAAGESTGALFASGFGVLWGASTLAVAALVLWRRLRPGASFAWTIAPGILAIMGLPWWEFGLGMDIADTFMTRGGMSWAMPWLAALACLATGAAVFALLRDRARAARVANAAA